MNKQYELRQADLERIKHLRLMDDDFLSMVFEGNFEATELLLGIVLKQTDKSDIKVTEVAVQKEYRSISERTIKLDIYAEDSDGKSYDVEVQRADRGASPQRARFHSSIMDSRLLGKNEPFGKIAESYVIFITEHDVLDAGLALYHVERTIQEMNHAQFGDGAHILYVNGSYHNDEDPVGRLMHDFRCSDPDEMYYETLAERTRYFKEDEGGKEAMCKIWEEVRDEGAERATIEMIRSFMDSLNLTVEQALAAAKVPDDKKEFYRKAVLSKEQA
jgi:hypothetical protein